MMQLLEKLLPKLRLSPTNSRAAEQKVVPLQHSSSS